MNTQSQKAESRALQNFLVITIACLIVIVALDLTMRKATLSFVAPILGLIFTLSLMLVFKSSRRWNELTTISVAIALVVFTVVRILQNSFTAESLILLLIYAYLGSIYLHGTKRVIVHALLLGFCGVVFMLVLFSMAPGEEFWNSVRTVILFTMLYLGIAVPTAKMQNALDQEREALQKSNNMLNEVNHTLEDKIMERTQMLSEKNKRLVNISFQNAHHIRGPLARILGLINLTKLDASSLINIIEKIQDQASELDQAIRDVGKEINTSIDDQALNTREESVKMGS